MSRRWQVTALTALCVAALTGCSGSATTDDEAAPSPDRPSSSTPTTTEPSMSPSVLTLDDGTAVLVAGDPPDTIGDVRYSGTITTVEGSCWGFDDGRGTGVLLLPDGTTVAPDGLGVVTPDGVTVHVGDSVSGGGYGAGSGSSLDTQWRAARPNCFAGRFGAALVAVKLTEASGS